MNRFSGIIISDMSDQFPIILNLQFSDKPQSIKLYLLNLKKNQINDKTCLINLKLKKKLGIHKN